MRMRGRKPKISYFDTGRFLRFSPRDFREQGGGKEEAAGARRSRRGLKRNYRDSSRGETENRTYIERGPVNRTRAEIVAISDNVIGGRSRARS